MGWEQTLRIFTHHALRKMKQLQLSLYDRAQSMSSVVDDVFEASLEAVRGLYKGEEARTLEPSGAGSKPWLDTSRTMQETSTFLGPAVLVFSFLLCILVYVRRLRCATREGSLKDTGKQNSLWMYKPHSPSRSRELTSEQSGDYSHMAQLRRNDLQDDTTTIQTLEATDAVSEASTRMQQMESASMVTDWGDAKDMSDTDQEERGSLRRRDRPTSTRGQGRNSCAWDTRKEHPHSKQSAQLSSTAGAGFCGFKQVSPEHHLLRGTNCRMSSRTTSYFQEFCLRDDGGRKLGETWFKAGGRKPNRSIQARSKKAKNFVPRCAFQIQKQPLTCSNQCVPTRWSGLLARRQRHRSEPNSSKLTVIKPKISRLTSASITRPSRSSLGKAVSLSPPRSPFFGNRQANVGRSSPKKRPKSEMQQSLRSPQFASTKSTGCRGHSMTGSGTEWMKQDRWILNMSNKIWSPQHLSSKEARLKRHRSPKQARSHSNVPPRQEIVMTSQTQSWERHNLLGNVVRWKPNMVMVKASNQYSSVINRVCARSGSSPRRGLNRRNISRSPRAHRNKAIEQAKKKIIRKKSPKFKRLPLRLPLSSPQKQRQRSPVKSPDKLAKRTSRQPSSKANNISNSGFIATEQSKSGNYKAKPDWAEILAACRRNYVKPKNKTAKKEKEKTAKKKDIWKVSKLFSLPSTKSETSLAQSSQKKRKRLGRLFTKREVTSEKILYQSNKPLTTPTSGRQGNASSIFAVPKPVTMQPMQNEAEKVHQHKLRKTQTPVLSSLTGQGAFKSLKSRSKTPACDIGLQLGGIPQTLDHSQWETSTTGPGLGPFQDKTENNPTTFCGDFACSGPPLQSKNYVDISHCLAHARRSSFKHSTEMNKDENERLKNLTSEKKRHNNFSEFCCATEARVNSIFQKQTEMKTKDTDFLYLSGEEGESGGLQTNCGDIGQRQDFRNDSYNRAPSCRHEKKQRKRMTKNVSPRTPFNASYNLDEMKQFRFHSQPEARFLSGQGRSDGKMWTIPLHFHRRSQEEAKSGVPVKAGLKPDHLKTAEGIATNETYRANCNSTLQERGRPKNLISIKQMLSELTAMSRPKPFPFGIDARAASWNKRRGHPRSNHNRSYYARDIRNKEASSSTSLDGRDSTRSLKWKHKHIRRHKPYYKEVTNLSGVTPPLLRSRTKNKNNCSPSRANRYDVKPLIDEQFFENESFPAPAESTRCEDFDFRHGLDTGGQFKTCPVTSNTFFIKRHRDTVDLIRNQNKCRMDSYKISRVHPSKAHISFPVSQQYRSRVSSEAGRKAEIKTQHPVHKVTARHSGVTRERNISRRRHNIKCETSSANEEKLCGNDYPDVAQRAGEAKACSPLQHSSQCVNPCSDYSLSVSVGVQTSPRYNLNTVKTVLRQKARTRLMLQREIKESMRKCKESKAYYMKNRKKHVSRKEVNLNDKSSTTNENHSNLFDVDVANSMEKQTSSVTETQSYSKESNGPEFTKRSETFTCLLPTKAAHAYVSGNTGIVQNSDFRTINIKTECNRNSHQSQQQKTKEKQLKAKSPQNEGQDEKKKGINTNIPEHRRPNHVSFYNSQNRCKGAQNDVVASETKADETEKRQQDGLSELQYPDTESIHRISTKEAAFARKELVVKTPELHKLCLMRPVWAKANVEEVDRRVERALRLRAQLHKSRAAGNSRSLTITASPTADTDIATAGEISLSQTEELQPSGTKDFPSDDLNNEITTENARSFRRDNKNGVEDSTFHENNKDKAGHTDRLIQYGDCAKDQIRGDSHGRKEVCPEKTTVPVLVFNENSSFESGSEDFDVSRTSFQQQSSFQRERSDGYFNSSAVGAGHEPSFRVERSVSYHEELRSEREMWPERPLSENTSSRQTNSNSSHNHLKRCRTQDKNSPPTKISKVENSAPEEPRLVGELVQNLPHVPLSSFVEWFIETSDPNNFISSERSSSSSGKRQGNAVSITSRAKQTSVPETEIHRSVELARNSRMRRLATPCSEECASSVTVPAMARTHGSKHRSPPERTDVTPVPGAKLCVPVAHRQDTPWVNHKPPVTCHDLSTDSSKTESEEKLESELTVDVETFGLLNPHRDVESVAMTSCTTASASSFTESRSVHTDNVHRMKESPRAMTKAFPGSECASTHANNELPSDRHEKCSPNESAMKWLAKRRIQHSTQNGSSAIQESDQMVLTRKRSQGAATPTPIQKVQDTEAGWASTKKWLTTLDALEIVSDDRKEEEKACSPGIRQILMRLRNSDVADPCRLGRTRITLRKSSDVTGIIAKFQRNQDQGLASS